MDNPEKEIAHLKEVIRQKDRRIAWHRGEYQRMYEKTKKMRERMKRLKEND